MDEERGKIIEAAQLFESNRVPTPIKPVRPKRSGPDAVICTLPGSANLAIILEMEKGERK